MSDETTVIDVEEDQDEPVQRLYRAAPPDLLIFREEGEPTIEGRVVPFNQWSEVNSVVEGHFMERFATGSLSKTIAERASELKVYFEHGKSRLFDSQPIAVLREAWEQPDGGYFRAGLLEGLPELFRDGLRRGLYGASIGAEVIKMDRNRRPGKSEHNPLGLEERTYKELRAFDYSITPRPHYASATVALRSITDDLLIERLLQEPDRLLELITRRDKHETEPQHSQPEKREEPVSEGSRSTQPHRDYLAPREGEPSWRL